jgi:hypothetical protein
MKTFIHFFTPFLFIAIFLQQKELVSTDTVNTTIITAVNKDNHADDGITLSAVDAASESYMPSNKILTFNEANKLRSDLFKQLQVNPQSIPINWALMRYYLTAPNLVGGSNYAALHYAGYIYGINHYLGCIAYETVYTYMHNWEKAEEWYKNSLNVNLPKNMYWTEITYSRKDIGSIKVIGNFNNWKMQNMYEKAAGLYTRKVMVPNCEGCQYKLVINNLNIQDPTKTETSGSSWPK